MKEKRYDNSSLEFELDFGVSEYRQMLRTAAAKISNIQNHLGCDRPEDHQTPEAALLESLTEDVAEFAGSPVVHRIIDKDFFRTSLQVPATFEQLSRRYRFYWIYFPLNLVPKVNWAYHRVELAIEFNPEATAPHTRPKAYQILPDQKFQEMLRMNTHLELRLDENFEFNIAAAPLKMELGGARSVVGAGVDAKAAAGIGLVAGPFIYTIKKANITHSPPGVEKIIWRLDGQEFFEGNTPAIIVIAQVPKNTHEVNIAGAMRVTRHFKYLSANLTSLIRHLPDAVADFFHKGMPLCSSEKWDITPHL